MIRMSDKRNEFANLRIHHLRDYIVIAFGDGIVDQDFERCGYSYPDAAHNPRNVEFDLVLPWSIECNP